MYKKTQTIFETVKEDLTVLNEDVEIIEEVKDGQKKILSCRCKKCGHEWTVLKKTFKRNPVCPNCTEIVKRPSRRISTEEWVESAKCIHPEYNLDKVNYVNNHTLITYICPKHGEKTAIPKIFQKPSFKCPDCLREERKEKMSDAAIENLSGMFPEYDFSNSVYKDKKSDMEVVCRRHGSFTTTYDKLKNGSLCPGCAHEKRLDRLNDETEEFKRKATEVHCGKYIYDKTDLNNKDEGGRVCITCPKHGDFWQLPKVHLAGQGCKKCLGRYMYTTEEVIRDFTEVHGDKYDYSLVDYKKMKEKVKIVCHNKDEFGREHGIFEQTPKIHLRGFGCPKCSGNYMDLELFKLRAGKIHDNYYNYSNITEYVDNKTKMPIECPEHGIFMQNANSHLLGQGCPACSISHLERSIFIYLRDNDVQFVHQYRDKDVFGLQSLDFYIKSKNIGIECQGEEHFIASYFKSKGIEYAENHLKEEKARDERKRQKCVDAGIRLIYYIEPKFEKFMQPNWEYATSLEKLLGMIGE